MINSFLKFTKKDIIVSVLFAVILLADVFLWVRNPLGKGDFEYNDHLLITGIILIIMDITFLISKKRWEGWEKKKNLDQHTSWWGVVAGLIFMALYFISL